MLVCTNFTDEEVSCPLLDEWKAGEVWIQNYEDGREGNKLRPYEAVIIAFTGKQIEFLFWHQNSLTSISDSEIMWISTYYKCKIITIETAVYRTVRTVV